MGKYDNWLARVSSLGHTMPAAIFGKDVYDAANSKQIEMYGKMMKCQEELDAIQNTTTATWKKKDEQTTKISDAFYLQRRIVEELSKNIDSVEISEGCKTHMLDIWIANEFGRHTKDIKNKYVEKGLQMEDSAIIMYSILSGDIHEKNTQRKDDTFIMGEIDFEKGDVIYDTKCSWDIFTFFKNIKYLDNPNSNPYYWNAQGYMKLWDKPKFKVVYTLLDTPEKLIENERKRIAYDFTGTESMLEEAYAELDKNMKYSDIPMNKRIIEIDIERNESDIAKIPLVIKACRAYLNSLEGIIYKNLK